MLFLAEFMLGALTFVFREQVSRSVQEELLLGIHKHYNVTREPGTLPALWDHIHQGVSSYSYYYFFLMKYRIKICKKKSYNVL